MLDYKNRPSAHKIPVRVINPKDKIAPAKEAKPTKTEASRPTPAEAKLKEEIKAVEETETPDANPTKEAIEEPQPAPDSNGREAAAEADTPWREQAQRLQAEMENFRKRQQRRAEEAIIAERERLLRRILPAVDNLSRALEQDTSPDDPLRQGIELTYREMIRVLQAEGVSRIETVGQEFDPHWHEALATIPAQTDSDTIVEEVEAGYRLDDRLLRPAKVVVAA